MEQLSFLTEPEPKDAPAVWQTLDEEQRAAIVAMVARLMAKTVTAATQKEPSDE